MKRTLSNSLAGFVVLVHIPAYLVSSAVVGLSIIIHANTYTIQYDRRVFAKEYDRKTTTNECLGLRRYLNMKYTGDSIHLSVMITYEFYNKDNQTIEGY